MLIIEFSVLMMYLKHHRNAEHFALVGHSTGCQNSIHFLKVSATRVSKKWF